MEQDEPIFMPSKKVAKYALRAKSDESPNLDFTSKQLPSVLSIIFNRYTNFFADIYLVRYAIGERIERFLGTLNSRHSSQSLDKIVLLDSENKFTEEFKKGMEERIFISSQRKDYDDFFTLLGNELCDWIRSNGGKASQIGLKLDSKNNLILECKPPKPVL